MNILPFKIEELLEKIDSPLIEKTDNKYQDLTKARSFNFGTYDIYVGKKDEDTEGWFLKWTGHRKNYNFKRECFEGFDSMHETSEFCTDIFTCLEKVKELTMTIEQLY